MKTVKMSQTLKNGYIISSDLVLLFLQQKDTRGYTCPKGVIGVLFSRSKYEGGQKG